MADIFKCSNLLPVAIGNVESNQDARIIFTHSQEIVAATKIILQYLF